MDQAQNMGTCNYAAQNWVSKSAGAVSVSSYDCVVEQKLTSRSANINLKLFWDNKQVQQEEVKS